jgi:hypothetical protein
VINDDIIEPVTGFPTHPHQDMEIFTYVIDGELTHKDSMLSSSTVKEKLKERVFQKVMVLK